MAYNINRINGNPILIGSGGLETGAVTEGKLADGSVTSAKLRAGSVDSARLADGSVTKAKIADGAVTSDKLQRNAVTGTKVASGSVTDDKLSQSAGQALSRIAGLQRDKVPYPATSRNGEAGQVLRSNGDGTTVWEYEAIPPESVIDDSISSWLDGHPEATTTVEDGAVTTSKLADGAVAYEKLGSSALDKLENRIRVVSPLLKGTSVYVEHGGRSVLLDCGHTEDESRMEDFLGSLGIERLDCVVITHFDNDHYGAIQSVAPYVDGGTKVYVQMEPPEDTENGTHDSYAAGLQAVTQALGGRADPTCPPEGHTDTFGDVAVTIHNTTAENRELYESVPTEGQDFGGRAVGLNNYSLIAIVDVSGYVITYSGDLEAAGQRVNAQHMPRANLAFTPHHISAVGGYLPWYTSQNADAWLGTTAASTFGQNIYVLNRYVPKLMRYNYIDDVMMTHDGPLEVEVRYGRHRVVTGESLSSIIAEENLGSVWTDFRQILPPSYVSDNPLVLCDLTLAQLIAACQRGVSGEYSASNFSGRGDWQVFKDLQKLVDFNVGSIANITFRVGRLAEVIFHQTAQSYARLIAYQNVNPDTGAGARLVATGNAFYHRFDAYLQDNDRLSDLLTSDEYSKLMNSQHVVFVTDGGLTIHAFRIQDKDSEKLTTGGTGFTGYATNAGVTLLYRVGLSKDGDFNSNVRNFSNGTVAPITNVIGVGCLE